MTNIIETTCKTLANTGQHDLAEKDLQHQLLRQMQELLCLFEEHWQASKH